jgi:hypothetical protein
MVLRIAVRWIPFSLEIYIRKILLVQKDWRIGTIPFAWRMVRWPGYQGKEIGGQRGGSNLSREKRSEN